MIKVSIVVPIYNVEKYLRQCLDSIVGQTLRDIEIICVNDGSTDSSREILAALAAEGESTVSGLEYVDRGYENLVEKLKLLGADVQRVE